MRNIFIGGTGRSGTSFVCNSLLSHESICGFKDSEFKLLANPDGLVDLVHALVTNYTPDRANIALRRFCYLFQEFISTFDVNKIDLRNSLEECFVNFTDSLKINDQACNFTYSIFIEKFTIFWLSISEVARLFDSNKVPPIFFVEKTPHNLLQLPLLSEIFQDSVFIHVLRDPRLVAYSLLKMEWGPDNISTCAEWVSRYFDTWENIEKSVNLNNINLHQIYIEEIAVNKQLYSAKITQQLNIAYSDKMFDDISTDILTRNIVDIDECSVNYLNIRLHNLVLKLGYNPNQWGQVINSKFPI